MRRAAVWLTATALSGLAVGAAVGRPAGHLSAKAMAGYDVSWPQCSGATAVHMPPGHPPYVILGLTYGSGHTVNPCLASQLDWARLQGVRTGGYLVATYPDRAQRRAARSGVARSCARPKLCVLRRDGASQARDALATMRRTGMHAPRVWIDVELRHDHPWTRHRQANAAVVAGIVRGLRAAHKPMGVYTTSYMWQAIVGGYRLVVPNWLPVGHGGPAKAEKMCRTTATGGVTWLAQYTRALDADLTCPVLGPALGQRSRLWPYRHTTLDRRAHSRAVRLVQRVTGSRVTGRYDARTTAAVRHWQRSHQLRRTGRVTPADWRAMGALRRHGGHGFQLSKVARLS
jgi:peptidoglycan hydrolase-like protein with peptidoglycan-binding domain